MELTRILRGVSRSFYLTLRLAPRGVRSQLGVSYLFCRAADTIADTALLPPERRLDLLARYRAQFERPEPEAEVAEAIASELTPAQSIPEERTLLQSLGRCFAAYLAFSEGDRSLVRRLVTTLVGGMEIDLRTFPPSISPGVVTTGDCPEPIALADDAALDRYCYHVAGCVGEFWTDLTAAHVPSLARWDLASMREKGVRFGKGLQMTNVLRDLVRDLRQGRCYLPRKRLLAAGIEPAELKGGPRPDHHLAARLTPILHDLLDVTLDHYRVGWEYTLAIPRREPRLRLACALPLLIGLETLALLRGRPADLLAGENLKIPRRRVWRILAAAGGSVFSGRALDRLYHRAEAAARMES